MYRVLRKPRHCDGPYGIGDTVTMNMEYHGLNKGGDAASTHNKDWRGTVDTLAFGRGTPGDVSW